MKLQKTALRILLSILAVLFWIGVWWIVADRIGKPLLLPAPPAVLERLLILAQTPAFWNVVRLSVTRILSGVLLSVLIGVILAILSSLLPPVRILLRPLLAAIRATPVAAFIVLIWLWIGADEVPTIITVLIALPVVYSNVETGIRERPQELCEMARAFRVPLFRRLLLLDVPAVLPSFHSALETSIGLGWKAGVAAEILVRPALAIGRKISDANYNLDSVDLFAWTLTVVLLSLLLEYLFSFLLDRVFRRVTPAKDKKEVAV